MWLPGKFAQFTTPFLLMLLETARATQLTELRKPEIEDCLASLELDSTSKRLQTLLQERLSMTSYNKIQSIILNQAQGARYENWFEQHRSHKGSPSLLTSPTGDEFSAFYRSQSFRDYKGNLWALKMPDSTRSVWSELTLRERIHLIDKLAHILHPPTSHRHPAYPIHFDQLENERVFLGKHFLFAGLHHYVPYFLGERSVDLRPYALASILAEMGAPLESMRFIIGRFSKLGGVRISWLEIKLDEAYPPMRVSIQLIDQFGLREMNATLNDPRSSLNQTYFKNISVRRKIKIK